MKSEKQKKTSMSFITALGLSANNLRTKKGRTIMTAFAGSIGIIGISLILALSSGVNDYIQSIQEDTLSEYPLQITGAGIDLASLLTSASSAESYDGDPSGEEDEAEISVTKVLTTMFSQVNANDLESLKEYIDSGESELSRYVKAVEYSYDIEPLIYLQDGNSWRQVNPDTSLNSSSSVMATLLTSGSSSFYLMPENEDLYKDQYDVKAGHWPESYNECVLVLTADGSISDYMLYTLGLRDYSELEAMIAQYNNGENVTGINDIGTYTYEDVLGITFTVLCGADLYAYDEEYDVWVDKSDNTAYMKNLMRKGEKLTITGVVQPSADAISANLTSGINYPMSLIYHISEQAASSNAVQAQMSNPKINIFTGTEFGETTVDFDLNSLLTIDTDALSDAVDVSSALADMEFDFSDIDFDLSDINFNLSDIGFDLSDIKIDFPGIEINPASLIPTPSAINIDALFPEIDLSTSLSEWANNLLAGYQTQLTSGGSNLIGNFRAFLESDNAADAISDILNNVDYTTIMVNSAELASLVDAAMKTQGASPQTIVDTITNYIAGNAVISINDSGLQALADELVSRYISEINTGFLQYLSLDTAAQTMTTDLETNLLGQITANINSKISDRLTTRINKAIDSMLEDAMAQITEQISDSLEAVMYDAIEDMIVQMSEEMMDSLSLDTDTLMSTFEFNMDSTNLTDLLTSMNLSVGSSYDSNLSSLGYVNFDSPTEIDIYPNDFESKDAVLAILDDYNAKMEQSEQNEKIIVYTDMVGTMMSSVTTIVDTVSYVLIAFIAVSLIVSCIMISIITQISVLERTKEIGILRAMGASKRNISQVFNAETFIIGACSGLIGVSITELLIFPINDVIHSLVGDSSVNAVLPWNYALVLVIISIVITVCSGLVPALNAAKMDPVAALRTE